MVVTVKPGRVKLDPGQPRLYVIEPNGPVQRDLERRMRRALFVARSLVRRRTGALMSSMRTVSGRSKRYPYVDLIAGKPGMRYTMIEHDGSAPHVIRAKKRRYLRFTVGGAVIFRTSVHHPGTTGTKYLTRSLDAAGN